METVPDQNRYFHICVSFRERGKTEAGTFGPLTRYAMDLSESGVIDFLTPFYEGRPIPIQDELVAPSQLDCIEIHVTEQSSEHLIPPLRAEHDWKTQQRDSEIQGLVIWPAFMNYFHSEREVFYTGSDCTGRFILPFSGGPKDQPRTGQHKGKGHMDVHQKRFAYLKHIYDLSGGDSARMFHWKEIGKGAGLTEEEAGAVTDYFDQKGMISGSLVMRGITAVGMDEVEQAERQPDRATGIFPAGVSHNITIHGGVHNSNLMQNSSGSSQAVSVSETAPESIRALAELVRNFRTMLPQLGLDAEQQEDAKEHLDSLEEQTKSEKPNEGRVRAGLRALRSLMSGLGQNIAANIAATQIMENLGKVLSLFVTTTHPL